MFLISMNFSQFEVEEPIRVKSFGLFFGSFDPIFASNFGEFSYMPPQILNQKSAKKREK
jgi:hypothetical protein